MTDKSISTGIKYWVCCIKESCLISNLSIIYLDRLNHLRLREQKNEIKINNSLFWLLKYTYSKTSVPRIWMDRIPWMAQTDLKVPSIFLIILSKKNSHLLTLNVPDEGYTRNVACTLNLLSFYSYFFYLSTVLMPISCSNFFLFAKQQNFAHTSGNRFVCHTGTFGNLIFSLVPSDNRNTRSTCPTSVFTGTEQSDKR
jgi:hypothetical protein